LKTVCLKIPDSVVRYFEMSGRDVRELSQGLLNDALKTILQQEAPENREALDWAGKL